MTTLKQFYAEFNKIVSGHTSVADTTKKLKALSAEVEKSDLKGKVNVDLSIIADLERIRLETVSKTSGASAMQIEEDEYDDSYESSYDEDDY